MYAWAPCREWKSSFRRFTHLRNNGLALHNQTVAESSCRSRYTAKYNLWKYNIIFFSVITATQYIFVSFLSFSAEYYAQQLYTIRVHVIGFIILGGGPEKFTVCIARDRRESFGRRILYATSVAGATSLL